jgi:hypothetical protein
VELGLLFAGLLIYARRCRVGGLALWVFAAFLLAAYLANVIGPPPPSARAVAIVGLVSWLLPVSGGMGHRSGTKRFSWPPILAPPQSRRGRQKRDLVPERCNRHSP